MAAGTLRLISKKAMEGYATLDADDRQAVKTLAAYVRKLQIGI